MSVGRATTGALARASLLLSVAFLVSRAFGYVRVAVLADTYGVGPELDAFYAAFRLPDLVYQLVAAGALTSGLVPVLAGLIATDQRPRARRVVTTLGLTVTIAVTAFTVVVWLLAPAIVPVITPGFDDAQLAETIELTRVMLAGPIFLALGSVASSWLNAQDRFGAGAMTPVAYNLGIIGGVLLLAPSMGIMGAAWGVIAGSLCYALAAWISAAYRRLLPARQVARDPEVGRALRMMLPRMLGLGASQLALTVMTALATGLPAGSVAAFATAQVLLALPLGLVGVPLGIVMLPSMSREVALGNLGEYRRMLTAALRVLLLVMAGIAAVGIAIAEPMVGILFPSTAGDGTAPIIASALAILLAGLPAHALIAVLARACYARGDTRMPVAWAIVAVLIDVVAGILLVGPLGLVGIGLAVAVGAWVEALGLMLALRRDAGLLLREVLAPVPAVLAASLAGGAVAYGIVVAIDGAGGSWIVRVIATTIAAAAGLAVHIAIAWLLRVPEVKTVAAIARTRMGPRMRRRPGGAA